MSTSNPLVQRYLSDFRRHLGRMSEQERNELCLELESHIHEALSAGQSMADVLERLGPAERLAKGYTVELLLEGQSDRGPRIGSLLAAAGLLAGTSLTSIMIVPLLAVAGVGFVLTGPLTAVLALVSFIVPSMVTVTNEVISKPAASASALLLGLVLSLVGWGCLVLLKKYLAFVTRAYRRTFAA